MPAIALTAHAPAPPLAAALTDAGLLLVLIVGGVAILAFLIFVLREALSHPVELPRELPPAHDLPPIADDPLAAAQAGAAEPHRLRGDSPDPPPTTGG